MTKQQAIQIFGSATEIGRACGITKSAVSQWPEILTERQTNEVIGAAIRLRKITLGDVRKLEAAA